MLVALLLTLAPATAQGFSKAIWGEVYRHGVSQFPLYHRLGVSIFEVSINWSLVAPTRPLRPGDPNDPAYNWPARVDQAIAQARPYHIRVLVQVNGAPPWANGGRADWRWAPRNPSDFSSFATAAARRYPDVHLWMIWGEPGRTFLPFVSARPGAKLDRAQRAAPRLYARLLDSAYGALKSVSNRNLVIGGDTYTSGPLSPLQWIENLRLQNGRAPRMDMYGHNPFSFRHPSFSAPFSHGGLVQFSDLPELAGWVDHYLHPGLPLFLSEFTVPTAPDLEMPYWVDPPVAGRWVGEALRLSRHWKRIYGLGWIHVYDDPPLTTGGLLNARGKPKATYWAFLHG
jgi:hypothetical protein